MNKCVHQLQLPEYASEEESNSETLASSTGSLNIEEPDKSQQTEGLVELIVSQEDIAEDTPVLEEQAWNLTTEDNNSNHPEDEEPWTTEACIPTNNDEWLEFEVYEPKRKKRAFKVNSALGLDYFTVDSQLKISYGYTRKHSHPPEAAFGKSFLDTQPDGLDL
jgi:hypothetical protein